MKQQVQIIRSIELFVCAVCAFFWAWFFVPARAVGQPASVLPSVLQTAQTKPADTTRATITQAASTDNLPTIGLIVNVPLPIYNASFRDLPGSSSLNITSEGAKIVTGMTFGISAETAIVAEDWLAQALQGIGINPERLRGGLQTDLQLWEGQISAEGNSRTNPATMSYTGTFGFNSIGLMPSLRMQTTFGLDVQAGLRLGLVTQGTLKRTEAPTAARPDSSRPQTIVFEARGAQALQPSLVLGAGWTLPSLDGRNTVLLQPQLALQIPLSASSIEATPWGRGVSWVRLGLGMTFDVSRAASVRRTAPDTVFKRDTTLMLVATGLANRHVRVARSIQQPPQKNALPKEPETLWGAVFGGRQSDATETTTDNPALNAVVVTESYLHEVPKPKPLITASVVAEFILPDGKRQKRVKLKAEKTLVRVYAPPPTMPNAPQLSFLKDSVFTPYIITDTLFTSRLPLVRFFPRIISETEIVSWRLEIAQRGRTLVEFNGAGTEAGENGVEWNPSDEPESLIRANQQLTYKLFITDGDNRTTPIDSGVITVDREEGVLSGSAQRIVEMMLLESPVQGTQSAPATQAAQLSPPSQIASVLVDTLSITDTSLLLAMKPHIKPTSRLRYVAPTTPDHARRVAEQIAATLGIAEQRIVAVGKLSGQATQTASSTNRAMPIPREPIVEIGNPSRASVNALRATFIIENVQ